MSVANQLSPATQFGHPSFPDGRRIRSLGSEELNECLIAESLTDASPYSERQGSMIPGNHKLTGNGLLGQMTLGSLARLPNRIAHDKGRSHQQSKVPLLTAWNSVPARLIRSEPRPDTRCWR
jgi:hypothetical protein